MRTRVGMCSRSQVICLLVCFSKLERALPVFSHRPSMPRAGSNGGARRQHLDDAMQKASADANEACDRLLEEKLHVDNIDFDLTCRYFRSWFLLCLHASLP